MKHHRHQIEKSSAVAGRTLDKSFHPVGKHTPVSSLAVLLLGGVLILSQGAVWAAGTNLLVGDGGVGSAPGAGANTGGRGGDGGIGGGGGGGGYLGGGGGAGGGGLEKGDDGAANNGQTGGNGGNGDSLGGGGGGGGSRTTGDGGNGGNGGIGGDGGGGATSGIGGIGDSGVNGVDGGHNIDGGAGGAGIGAGTSSNANVTIDSSHPVPGNYEYVGIGGGGGGAAGGGNFRDPGGAGSNGALMVDGANLTVTKSLLVGGGGGGGSGSSATGVYSGSNGGNGGDGTLVLENSASISVADTLLIGGNSGGNGSIGISSVRGGGIGGAGGNGTVTVDGSSSINIGSGGAGRLILGGGGGSSGVLNLGGNLSFSVGSTFDINGNGVLNIGNDVAGGALAGTIGGADITNNGRINFNQSNGIYRFDTGITGSGSVLQNSAGITTLGGTNTYSGATTVSAGTLQAGIDDTFSSNSAVSINTGATLDLDSYDQTIGSLAGSGDVTLGSAKLITGGDNTSTAYSGVISGTGSLEKKGSGVQTLNGANTYTGGTNITAGTLAIGANGSLAATGEVKLTTGTTFDISAGSQTIGALKGDGGDVVLGSRTLTLGGGDSGGVFFGTIDGTGALVKIGSGSQLVLSNRYAGNTTVSAGTLSFASYNQGINQILGIGVRSNTDYGQLSAGTATFQPDAKIVVNVTGNALAQGEILDDVILASTLHATTFNVTDNSALFNFEADVDLAGGTVDLNIVQASSTNSGVQDAVAAAGNAPAAGAAHALDAIIAAGSTGGDMDAIVTALGQLPTQGDVSRAVTQTLPLLSGGVTQATLGMLGSFNRTLQERVANLSTGTSTGASAGNPSGLSGGNDFADRHAWAKAFGSRADQDDRNGTSGFSSESWGMAFGADVELDRDTRLGVAYAYANSSVNGNTDLSGTQQRADVDSHLLAIYGSRSLANALQLDVQADIGRNSIDGTRHIDFGGLNRTASSSYASYSAHVGAGLSKTLALSEATSFAPGVRVDYTWLRDQGYRESGADALNLHVDGNTTEAFVITAEGRMRHALSNRAWLTANLGIGYDAINDRGSIVSVYAGAPGQSFATSGIEHSPWMVSGGIGYTMQVDQGTQVSLRYDVEGRDDYLNQTASVKANWQF